MTTKTALLATLVLAASACEKDGGTSNPPADGATTETATPAESDGGTEAAEPAEAKVPPGAPDVKWADKTFKQRQEHMGIVFFPKMKERIYDF